MTAAISSRTWMIAWLSPITAVSPNAAKPRRKRGKLLGVGVATAVAASGGRDYEHAEIRFDPSGGVVLMTGSMDHGQGTARPSSRSCRRSSGSMPI